MQSKDKDVLFPIPVDRWQKYCEAKRNLRGERRPEIFPVGQTDGICAEPNEAQKEIYDIASTMTARQYASWGGNFLQEVTKGMSQGYRVYDPSGLSTTLAGEAGGVGAKTGLYVTRWPLKFLERNQKNIEGDYSYTVDSMNTGGVNLGGHIRRLTPVECCRLQGFPDNWLDDLSDNQKYKCLGNAVTTNVIEYIGRQLVKFIE